VEAEEERGEHVECEAEGVAGMAAMAGVMPAKPEVVGEEEEEEAQSKT
jgi:hypothetical protein